MTRLGDAFEEEAPTGGASLPQPGARRAERSHAPQGIFGMGFLRAATPPAR